MPFTNYCYKLHLVSSNPGVIEEKITLMWLDEIRKMIRKEKGESEEYCLPSNDSLKLHRMSCYILQIWQQANTNIINFEKK